jgi:VIT1/CCC1 family predicted Fe2+/Mn2+ transporter
MRRQTRHAIPFGPTNFLSILEGIEGGFAIFVGIVAGLYLQAVPHDILIMTGVIGLIVNAFNSSAVRYASEHYLDELDGHEKRRGSIVYLIPAVVEFITYALVSFVAVIPLLLIEDSGQAIGFTVALTVVILFLAGAYRGTLLGRHAVRDGLELAGLGIGIIMVGTLAGWIVAAVVA